MGKRLLYLDLDDTVFDTEKYLRDRLGGKWVSYNSLIYLAYGRMSEDELAIVQDVFSDYSNIPLKEGALEALKVLKELYNVVLCSAYQYDFEKKAKLQLAKEWGIPIELCSGSKMDKSHIDMRDAIFIEDNPRNLNKSNANIKICFYHWYNSNVEKLKHGEVLYNWKEIEKYLGGS